MRNAHCPLTGLRCPLAQYHVRPNVFQWDPKAHGERKDIQDRRREAERTYKEGRKLVERGDLEQAERSLQLAVASWPDNHKLLLALGDCISLSRGDPARWALAALHPCVVGRPDGNAGSCWAPRIAAGAGRPPLHSCGYRTVH